MISNRSAMVRQVLILSNIIMLLALTPSIIEGSDGFSIVDIVSGLNTSQASISSGRLRFIETQRRAPRLSEVEIQERIKNQIDYLNSQWEEHKRKGCNTLSVERFFERDIAGAPYYIRSAYAPEERREEVTCLFEVIERNQDGTTQQYRYKADIKNILIRDKSSEQYKYIPYDYSAVCGFDSTKLTEIVHRESTDMTMDFANIYPRYSYGDFEYSGIESYGHCAYKVPYDAKLLSIKSGPDGQSQVYILQFSLPSGVTKKIWVDPAKDFLVLRSETYNANGLLSYFFEFSNPTKFGYTWYPRRIRSVTLKNPISSDETISNDNIRVDLTREVLEATFNIQVTSEDINVQIPTGISVEDMRFNPSISNTLFNLPSLEQLFLEK